MAAIVVVSVALAFAGCAGRRAAPTTAIDDERAVAVYRGRVQDGQARPRAFEARMFAREPDRLHVEISGPVGGPRLIVDGGSGRIAVHIVSERTAYVGTAGRDGARCALGLELTLDELVAAMLRGRKPIDIESFERVPPAAPGWPARLKIATGSVVVDLERKRVTGLPAARVGSLGTGRPPPGARVLPLDRLCDDTERPRILADGAGD